MTSVWDDPEMAIASDYVKFEHVGDGVSGTVTAVQVHRFDDGKVAPKLIIETDDGEEKALTAGQVRLRAALAEQRPEAGDHIAVTFTQEEKRPGGKTLKHFDVEVVRSGAAPAAPAAAAPVAAAKTLTAEQQAAIDALKAQGVL
jgi:hypothetical protein